jgi:uncharacterized protein (TIGR00266 family)
MFCTSCGQQAGAGARFCPHCGVALVDGAATVAPVKLDYDIVGDNLQAVRVQLKPGQELYAEAGKMLYKTPAIQWETRMSGHSLGEKIWGAVKRKLAGESLFLTYFRAMRESEVGFAGDYPGRIQALELAPGQSVLVQRDSFVCGQSTVQFSIAFVRRLGAGIFGGEGFILQKLTGPGTVFIHAGGDHITWHLQPGESLQIDTGCVVAFEESVSYDIQYVGGIKTALFGGEGFFLTTLTGPGKVIVQTMTLEKLRRQMRAGLSGGDERSPMGSLTGLLRSED